MVAEQVTDSLRRVSITVVAERTDDEWRAVVTTGTDQRELRGASCEAIADAASFVVALALRQAEQSALPINAPAMATTAPAPVPDLVIATPSARPEVPIGIQASLYFMGDVGTLSRATVGPRMSIGVRRGALAAHVVGSYWMARQSYANLLGYAEVDGWSAGGRACLAATPLQLCGGADVGRLRGRARGFEGARSQAGTTASVVGGATWAVHITGAMSLSLGVEAAAAVHAPTFVLADQTVLFDAAPVAGRLLIGAELEIP